MVPRPTVPSPGRTAVLVRLELHRTVRKSVSWSIRSAILLGLLPLVLLVYSVGLGVGGYLLGPVLRAGEIPAVYPRAAAGGVLAMAAFFTAQRAIKQTGRLDNADGILVAVPVADAVLGQVIAEYCRAVAFLAVPALAAGAGLAVGTGSAAVGVALVATVAALTALGVVLGYVAGLAAKNVAARSAFVAAHRTAIGLGATLLLFGGYAYGTADPATGGALFELLATIPFSWVADVSTLPVGAGAPALAAAGVGSVVVGIAGALSLGTVLADRLWFADPVQPDERIDGGGGAGRVEGILAALVGRQATLVALKSWRRAARAPFTVQYAIVPFFGLITPIQQTVRTGQIPGYLPAMLALCWAWATGAAFALNPVGGEGAALPVVLTANVPGRRFLGGLTLAGVVVGVPGTLLTVAATGALATTPPWLVATWAVVGAALALSTPGIGAAAGVTFPKFEYTSIGSNREAIIPSVWAFLLYSVVLAVVVAPALVAVSPFVLEIVADVAGLPATAVAGVGVGTSTLLAAVAGLAGFRYAVYRFEGYHLD